MKNIRVHIIIWFITYVYALVFLLFMILNKFSDYFNKPMAIIAASTIIVGLSSFLGIIMEGDIFKNLKGFIIDEKEKINWHLNNSFFLICAIIQLIFAFSPGYVKHIFGYPDPDGLLISSLVPTFIFVLRTFVKRTTINEMLVLKQLRRDRIRTEDLEVLQIKVNLEKWIKEDPILQRDKDLFPKLASISLLNIDHFDDSLKCNKDFILGLPSINYEILNWVSVFHIKFQETDFNDELILKILEQSDDFSMLRGNSDFAKIYTKKIIDLYENRIIKNDGLTPDSIVEMFFKIKNALKSDGGKIQYPSIESFKVCINDKHIIDKEIEKCPNC